MEQLLMETQRDKRAGNSGVGDDDVNDDDDHLMIFGTGKLGAWSKPFMAAAVRAPTLLHCIIAPMLHTPLPHRNHATPFNVTPYTCAPILLRLSPAP